ncbi:hypothetical protein THRCLA_01611, partial [Thraustotheca clavata]
FLHKTYRERKDMADELSQVLPDMDLRVPPFVLTMHPRTTSSLSHQEITALQSAGLFTIRIGPETPIYVFQREHFKNILKQRDLIMNMSKDHCQLIFRNEKLYAKNLSSASNTQVNRRYMLILIVVDVGVMHELHDRSELCMFDWLQYTVRAMAYTRDKATCRNDVIPVMAASHLIVCVINDHIHVMFANPLITKNENMLLIGQVLLKYFSSSTKRLSFKNEYHSIISGLADSNNPLVSVKLSFATYFSLIRAMLDGCRVLHFGGHGRPGELFFEGDASEPLIGTIVNCNEFTKFLGITPPQSISQVSLVVLLVCHSESMGNQSNMLFKYILTWLANSLINYGIRHIIAVKMDSKLRDWVASVFSQRFYSELGSGATVQNAYISGIKAVQAHDLSNANFEAAKILLLPQSISHDEVILPMVTQDAYQLKHFPNPFERCVASESIEFRHKEECVISTYLARPPHHQFYTRLMIITGEEGVGKSHLARAIGDDLEIRGYFDGGVHTINVQTYVTSFSLSSGDNLYTDVQAEVSASLKAFSGSCSSYINLVLQKLNILRTTAQCLIILDNCDLLVEDTSAFAAFVDAVLGSHPCWKLLVTCTSVDDHLQNTTGFSIMTYNVLPLGFEECCQLFAHMMAKAKYPITVLHFHQKIDPKTPKSELWKLLLFHPLTKNVLRGLPKVINRVVDDIVAQKTTIDDWYQAYLSNN